MILYAFLEDIPNQIQELIGIFKSLDHVENLGSIDSDKINGIFATISPKEFEAGVFGFEDKKLSEEQQVTKGKFYELKESMILEKSGLIEGLPIQIKGLNEIQIQELANNLFCEYFQHLDKEILKYIQEVEDKIPYTKIKEINALAREFYQNKLILKVEPRESDGIYLFSTLTY